MKLILLVLALSLVKAYPQTSPPDFLNTLTNKVMKEKFKDNKNENKSFLSSEILSCISDEYRKNINTCEEKLKHLSHVLPMVSECILVDYVKALNNVTRLLDVKLLQTSVIESPSISLTADQKKLASAKLESCIESDFALPPPPFIERDGKPVEFVPKYDKHNSPLRAMICVVNALIENGCSSVKVEKRSVTGPINDMDVTSS